MPEGIGIIIAAAIAAFASLIVVIVTKEQKISEFRQQWIDSFRSDVADLLSDISYLRQAQQFMDPRTSRDEFLKNHRVEMQRVGVMDLRIQLRLNRNEDLHQKLEKQLQDITKRLENPEKNWPTYEEKIVPLLQDILKKEWERVKRGEKMHLLAQKASIWLLVVTVIAAATTGIYQAKKSEPLAEGRPSTPKSVKPADSTS